MKFWMSKYAMTRGIEDIDAELSTSVPGHVRHWWYGFLRVGTQAHETYGAAAQAADAARIKRIASLRKQIAKLEAMRFE